MKNFYQMSFTRLGGNDMTAGWQSLNETKGIPFALKELFERTERTNQPMDRATPKDKDGKDLCMLEVISEGNNLGLVRVQYGLADSFGRENMYCHGFLFQNAYDLLKDPNNLLRISDKNFHFTPEETEKEPDELLLDEPLTDAKALEICGMTKEAYTCYVSCVYYALATNSKTSIYVKTDGSDTMARALLYLIYAAIPYSLRPKISAATYESARSNVMLVLCQEIPSNAMYVDPVTMENNILTENLQRRWKRYPFVEYYTKYYDHERIAGRSDAYYGRIEKWLTQMGDPSLKNMDAIRLAFSMLWEEKTQDVAGLLYDWLSLPVPNNETLEMNVARLLKLAIEQDLDLGEEREEMLFQRVDAATFAELIELGNQYRAQRLMKKTPEEGAEHLEKLSEEAFGIMRANIAPHKAGMDILEAYYLRQARRLLARRGTNYNDIKAFMTTFADLGKLQSVEEELASGALKFANDRVLEGESVMNVGKKLRDFMKECFPEIVEEQTETGNSVWHECFFRLAKTYDQMFRKHFSGNKLEEYASFYEPMLEKYNMFPYSADLLKKYQAIRSGDFATVTAYVENGCKFEATAPKNDAEKRAILETLLEFAMQCGAAETCQSIAFWAAMAQGLGENIVAMLIARKVRVFCVPEQLEKSLVEDEYWTEQTLEMVFERYKGYAERTGDNLFRKNAELVVRELKRRQDEAKKAQREQKKQEREAAQKESQGDEGKRSLFDIADVFSNRSSNTEKKNADEYGAYEPENEEVSNNAPAEKGGLLSGISKLFSGKGGRDKK